MVATTLSAVASLRRVFNVQFLRHLRFLDCVVGSEDSMTARNGVQKKKKMGGENEFSSHR
jgi:hypothetical protein